MGAALVAADTFVVTVVLTVLKFRHILICFLLTYLNMEQAATLFLLIRMLHSSPLVRKGCHSVRFGTCCLLKTGITLVICRAGCLFILTFGGRLPYVSLHPKRLLLYPLLERLALSPHIGTGCLSMFTFRQATSIN